MNLQLFGIILGAVLIPGGLASLVYAVFVGITSTGSVKEEESCFLFGLNILLLIVSARLLSIFA